MSSSALQWSHSGLLYASRHTPPRAPIFSQLASPDALRSHRVQTRRPRAVCRALHTRDCSLLGDSWPDEMYVSCTVV